MYTCKVDKGFTNLRKEKVMDEAIKIALAIYFISDMFLNLYKKYLEVEKLRLENKKTKSELRYRRKY